MMMSKDMSILVN